MNHDRKPMGIPRESAVAAVGINRALWTLAEGMQRLKTA